jgi:succinate-semialdehyde dehydrogenase/glutarate-semialdehyde dehydrogenase
VTTGPLINMAAVDKVRAHLDDALSRGATRFAAAETALDPGRFVAPVVLTGATSQMRLASEETFGPVAPLFRFRHEEEAIALANDTPYGLASYFYTRDLNRAFRVAERLETGMVGLNTGTVSMEVAPFGGVKQSGLGREGGREGIEEYLETKALHIGGLDR